MWHAIHSVPSLYVLEMIKNNPSIFQITTKLHSLDQINTIGNTINRHLKEEHLLIWKLSKKTIILNVIVTTFRLEQKNVVNISSIGRMALEQHNKITNVGKTQGHGIVHHLVQVFPFQKLNRVITHPHWIGVGTRKTYS